MPVVYLIHFDRPYHHAGHYVGWAHWLQYRLANHAAGAGARLMHAVTRAGIGWRVARVWRGKTRAFERQIKNRKYPISFICPLCDGPTARNAGQLARMVRERGTMHRRRLRAAQVASQLDPRDGSHVDRMAPADLRSS